MNEQLVWFGLIVGVTLCGVVLMAKEAMRQESREQFWREHVASFDDVWEDYRRGRHEMLVAMGKRPVGSHHDDYMDDKGDK